MIRRAVIVALGAALAAGCSHPAPPSPDQRFVAQATTILGRAPDDPAHLIRSIKVMCANSDQALAITTSTQPPGSPFDLVRAGLLIYCPQRVPIFDAARPRT